MQQDQPDNAATIGALFEAVRQRRVIEATYNGERLELWPHEVFVRNEAIHVRAHNPQKALRHDEKPRLGNFNAAGLRDIAISEARFAPLPSFDPAEREGEQSIAAVGAD